MSIKSDLLKRIEKDAQKIRDKRIEAANNKSIETAVFEFFKNIEESRKMYNGLQYAPYLYIEAKKALKERINSYAPGTKISIEFNNSISDDTKAWEFQTVRGVTIWWSQSYIKQYNVDPSLYIDVSQMLFI